MDKPELLVGFFMPMILAIVIQKNWNQKTQSAVTFLACAVVAVAMHYLDATNTALPGSFVSLLASTVAIYHGVYSPSGVAWKIEEATNLSEDD